MHINEIKTAIAKGLKVCYGSSRCIVKLESSWISPISTGLCKIYTDTNTSSFLQLDELDDCFIFGA